MRSEGRGGLQKDNEYAKLCERYIRRFDEKPQFLGRAPGRVNLIGEHTDYNGCPVLPMALERDFKAVFSPAPGGRVILSNTDPGFPDREFEISRRIDPYSGGDWGNYCKAGVQAVIDYLRDRPKASDSVSNLSGFRAVIRGTIPPAAGLSSSSALVVLTALMFTAANSLEIPFEILAQLLAEGERYVGTQGGGMDQASSLLSSPGKAIKIDFNPFTVRDVEMPEGFTVVVADSMVKAAKTGDAMDRYNLRTIECRLGVALLAKSLEETLGGTSGLRQLGDLTPENLGMGREEILDYVEKTLTLPSYSLKGIAGLLRVEPSDVEAEFSRRRDGSVLPEPERGYKIRQRVLHVLTEWKRVEDSVTVLEGGGTGRFGELMNRSHESCRDLYEISCPELEALTSAAREAGALGSRLTGAGFGGCTVSLVGDDAAEKFMDEVFQRYYREYLDESDVERGEVIFPCKPGGGASTEPV
ncbi:MAG: galactokinase [Spirochaetia bacterium]